MTREYTIWYKCLFCTRVYPKSHQLVEHRNLNHAEQWRKRKLDKKLEELKNYRSNSNEEISNEENEWSDKEDSADTMEIHANDECSSANELFDGETNSDDTASTVVINGSEADTEFSNDELQTENDDKDCQIVYNACINKKVEIKLSKCDENLIRIKREADLLEEEEENAKSRRLDSNDDFAPVVPMSGCLKEPVNNLAIRTDRIFKLYKCSQCNKQFLHKWGLKLHQDVHSKNDRKKF